MAIQKVYSEHLPSLFSVGALVQDYIVRHFALCNKHEKEFSYIPWHTFVVQNPLILTNINAFFHAQKGEKKGCLDACIIPPKIC
jgi:hypothetical protein